MFCMKAKPLVYKIKPTKDTQNINIKESRKSLHKVTNLQR